MPNQFPIENNLKGENLAKMSNEMDRVLMAKQMNDFVQIE